MSKTEHALSLMKRRWLSPIQSLNLCGLHALSQQVGKLRARGVDIEVRPVRGERYVQYRAKRKVTA